VSLREFVAEVLRDEGYDVETAEDGTDALEKFKARRADLVITDIRMPGMTGIELLEAVKKLDTRTEVIIMTSHASLGTSVEALRLGAYDYLIKPFDDINTLTQLVRRTVERIELVQRNQELLKELQDRNQELKSTNVLLEQRNSTVTTLLDYSQNLSSVLELEDFYKQTVESVQALADWRPCVFFRATGNRQLEPVALVGAEQGQVEPLPLPDLTPTDVVSYLQKLDRDPTFLNALRGLNPKSVFVGQVTVQGGLLGLLAVVDQKESTFPADAAALLRRFMNQVGITGENVALHSKVKDLAIKDGLTGLFNHRYFQERFRQEFGRAKRYGSDLSLVFCDIDYFKKYNDANGHPAGDALLRQVAQIILGRSQVATNGLRSGDLAARYGGEEFVIMLPETPRQGGVVRAERLRKTIEETVFAGASSQPEGKVTLSSGVAGLRPEHTAPSEVIQEADQALYQAKAEGRNRVCVWEPMAADQSKPAQSAS
jgi:diguanylate cyclase (GGDEF)-like protein